MATTLPDNVVQVAELSKKFPNGPLALNQVSLEVPKGQLLSLIGLSGSGKSTLLRHLNGLIQPTAGTVNVLDTNVVAAGRRELRALRREVGFVFQAFGLVGRLTALENVLSGALGRLNGPRFGTLMYPKTLRREALENLDRVGLGDQVFQRSDTLSGGQQQRVAIARAYALNPQVLLMDEPCGALDAQTRVVMQEELVKLARKNPRTVLFITHAVEEAVYLADRVVVMTSRPGKIKEILDVKSVREAEQWDRHSKIEDVMDLESFVHLRTRIWKSLREEHAGTDH